VLVMMNSGMADVLEPPRVARVRFPFGRPMGEPSNPDQSRVILEDALQILETATEHGTVVHLPYRWRREDYAQIRRDRAAKAKTTA
jgi:hypothetical protein